MAIDDNTSYELTGAQVKDLASRIKSKAGKITVAYFDLNDTRKEPFQGTLYKERSLTTAFKYGEFVDAYKSGELFLQFVRTSAQDDVYDRQGLITAKYYDGDPDSQVFCAKMEYRVTRDPDPQVPGDFPTYNSAPTIYEISFPGGESDPDATLCYISPIDLGLLSDINDGTLTIQQNGTDVATFTANASTNKTANITTPNITLTTTDPGEGSVLAENNFVGVYGGDPIIMDYSLNEINTGMKWINGDTIYKKTISLGNLPNATQKSVSHGISNLKYLVHMSGGAFRPGDNGHFPLPYPSNTDAATINISAGPSDIFVVTGSDRSGMTGYVTMYYTKNS